MPTLSLKKKSVKFQLGIPSQVHTLGSAPNLEAIEDIRQLVCTKFSVGTYTGPGPAHPHLSDSHSLKLKVPLALCDTIGFLCSKHSDFVSTGAAWSGPAYIKAYTVVNT